MTLHDVVAGFNTTPFIFAGSGITRRYYGLPDWAGLLEHFAQKVKCDPFAYRYYENKACRSNKNDLSLPSVASCIEKDFNEAWFENQAGVRSSSETVSVFVSSGVSPFKAEIGEYIGSLSILKDEYSDEIKKLRSISKNNISGIITTNYDCFFESLFDGYKTFVGQEELVFSQLQGMAEIYKIHGSISAPNSIVITENDYTNFKSKRKYLAAKLMTIFMEYPIIFIGYSLSDPDVQDILADVVECLPVEKIETLQKRFVFVEYSQQQIGVIISSHSLSVNGHLVEMTKVSLSDFGILYDALSAKRASFPVKLLRRFKDDLYTFVLTQQPGPAMRVAPLEDERIDENTLALTIGLAPTGVYGLASAVNAEQWYRNIILHDLNYPCDQMLEYVYPDLAKRNSWKIPPWYYLRNSSGNKLAENHAPNTYREIVNDASIKRNKTAVSGRSAIEVWTDEKSNLPRALRLLSSLPEDKIDALQCQHILEDIFKDNPKVFDSLDGSNRSNLKKMIRIYDFLYYGKEKRPHDSSACKQTPS